MLPLKTDLITEGIHESSINVPELFCSISECRKEYWPNQILMSELFSFFNFSNTSFLVEGIRKSGDNKEMNVIAPTNINDFTSKL